MKFYKTIDGKQFPVHENELKKYKEICKRIWGASPYDVSWAIDSPLYKNELNELLQPMATTKANEKHAEDQIPNDKTI